LSIFAGDSKTKTQRLLGTTGKSMPAMRAIPALHGPAALITIPADSRSPLSRITSPTLLGDAMVRPVTVAARYSTP
jgi:hypothetical protein